MLNENLIIYLILYNLLFNLMLQVIYEKTYGRFHIVESILLNRKIYFTKHFYKQI
jgi:hypothetical protein